MSDVGTKFLGNAALEKCRKGLELARIDVCGPGMDTLYINLNDVTYFTVLYLTSFYLTLLFLTFTLPYTTLHSFIFLDMFLELWVFLKPDGSAISI